MLKVIATCAITFYLLLLQKLSAEIADGGGFTGFNVLSLKIFYDNVFTF